MYERGQRGRHSATLHHRARRSAPQRGSRLRARRRWRGDAGGRWRPPAVDRAPGRAHPTGYRPAGSRPLPWQPPERLLGSRGSAGRPRLRGSSDDRRAAPRCGGPGTEPGPDRARGRPVLAGLGVRRAVPDAPVGSDVPGRHPGPRDRHAGHGQGGRRRCRRAGRRRRRRQARRPHRAVSRRDGRGRVRAGGPLASGLRPAGPSQLLGPRGGHSPRLAPRSQPCRPRPGILRRWSDRRRAAVRAGVCGPPPLVAGRRGPGCRAGGRRHHVVLRRVGRPRRSPGLHARASVGRPVRGGGSGAVRGRARRPTAVDGGDRQRSLERRDRCRHPGRTRRPHASSRTGRPRWPAGTA